MWYLCYHRDSRWEDEAGEASRDQVIRSSRLIFKDCVLLKSVKDFKKISIEKGLPNDQLFSITRKIPLEN
jgi:hypothetical protein